MLELAAGERKMRQLTYAVDTPGMCINPEDTGDTDPAIATIRGYIALVFLILVDLGWPFRLRVQPLFLFCTLTIQIVLV